jgi:hypothetical protein
LAGAIAAMAVGRRKPAPAADAQAAVADPVELQAAS